MRSLLTTWALPTALIAVRVYAQTHSSKQPTTIMGCSEVDCPILSKNLGYNCTLVDESFYDIGLVRIPINGDHEAKEALSGLSWVQGNSIKDYGYDNRPTERSLKKIYYLGTPYGLDLGDARACAAFFYEPPALLSWNNSDTDDLTCDRPMHTDCVESLLERAQSLSVEEDEDPCLKLEKEIQKASFRCPKSPASTSEYGVIVRRK